MSKLSKVDSAIKIVEFNLKSRRERVDQISKKLEQTDKEKIFVGQELELIKNVYILIESVKKENLTSLGRIPPQAHDIEEAVIGAMLLEPNRFDGEDFLVLKPEHFHYGPCEEIYKMILSMRERNIPIDIRSIVLELNLAGKLELIGGAYYVADITSRMSSSANASWHIVVLIEFAGKRKMLEMCSKIISDAFNGGDFFEMIEYITETLTSINSWIEDVRKLKPVNH